MAWIQVTEDVLDVIPDRYKKPTIKAVLLKSKYYVDMWENFTTVTLRHGSTQVVGVAKRNPRDKRNGLIGIQVAWVRAYRRFAEVYETAA